MFCEKYEKTNFVRLSSRFGQPSNLFVYAGSGRGVGRPASVLRPGSVEARRFPSGPRSFPRGTRVISVRCHDSRFFVVVGHSRLQGRIDVQAL